MPKISVIMPVYKAEKYIEYAVNSILNQQYADFELLIIDDKGNDDSVSIIRKIKDSRIKIIENERNRGIAYSRNKGLDAACGEYIALMDDDDWAPPYRFEVENDFLDTNTDIAAVGGSRHIIDENNQIIRYNDLLMLHNPGRIKAELMFHNVIANGSMMFRKRIVEEHAISYQDNMYGMEDYKFWIDYSVYGNIVNLNETLLYWRDGMSNETRKNRLKKEYQETFGKIQEYALKIHGFCLDEEEIQCFQNNFSINGRALSTKRDLEQLYPVMKKIISQGKELNFVKELDFVCRHMYGRRVTYSDLWSE